MERDAAAYLQLIEAKDESIVRLTNQLHEVELQAKIDQVRTSPLSGLLFRTSLL
jgi:hypothetical protein